jgi:hypothetical protein
MNDLLKKIFELHGWDFDDYQRLISNAQFDQIIILNSQHINDAERFAGVHVKEWMRFGNSIYQLSNIVRLGLKLSLKMVFYEEEHPLFDVRRLELTTGIAFVRRRALDFTTADNLLLSGRFFFDSPYGLFKEKERQAVLDRHIAPLLPKSVIGGSPYIDASTLSLHVRAGDIFSSLIHRGYGQPPLAYYKRVVSESESKRVLIIAEDMGNPIIAPLIGHVRACNREVLLYIGDLAGTLQLLFNSHELAAGIGSFVWAVQALSPHIKKYWYFERIFDQCIFARPNITVARVSDKLGEYTSAIMQNNWQNTPEQLAMMTDYREDSLVVEQW